MVFSTLSGKVRVALQSFAFVCWMSNLISPDAVVNGDVCHTFCSGICHNTQKNVRVRKAGVASLCHQGAIGVAFILARAPTASSRCASITAHILTVATSNGLM